jgi:flagellar basal-body rod protein FlgB
LPPVIIEYLPKKKGIEKMSTIGLFRGTISLLEKSLNLRSMQHRVLASNIANMDTPNYKAVELAVEEEIIKKSSNVKSIQLMRTRPEHIPLRQNSANHINLQAAKPPKFSLRGDGNTVDLDRTMGKLAENTILYKTAAQIISRKFNGLKNAIKGGGN